MIHVKIVREGNMLLGLIKIKRLVRCKACDGTGKIKTSRYPSCGYSITKCGCCYGIGKIEKWI